MANAPRLEFAGVHTGSEPRGEPRIPARPDSQEEHDTQKQREEPDSIVLPFGMARRTGVVEHGNDCAGHQLAPGSCGRSQAAREGPVKNGTPLLAPAAAGFLRKIRGCSRAPRENGTPDRRYETES